MKTWTSGSKPGEWVLLIDHEDTSCWANLFGEDYLCVQDGADASRVVCMSTAYSPSWRTVMDEALRFGECGYCSGEGGPCTCWDESWERTDDEAIVAFREWMTAPQIPPARSAES